MGPNWQNILAIEDCNVPFIVQKKKYFGFCTNDANKEKKTQVVKACRWTVLQYQLFVNVGNTQMFYLLMYNPNQHQHTKNIMRISYIFRCIIIAIFDWKRVLTPKTHHCRGFLSSGENRWNTGNRKDQHTVVGSKTVPGPLDSDSEITGLS